MFQLRRDIDDLIGRAFGDAWNEGSATQPAEGLAWTPAVEGLVEDGHIVIRMALPGVDPKNVEVSLEQNELAIKGQRKRESQAKSEHYFAREVVYGRFERRFTLPEGVDPGKVYARFSNGMLEVKVPSPVAAAPRKVDIEVQGDSQQAVKAG
jgi:HSP20 family protein